jgi:hypothetical protein
MYRFHIYPAPYGRAFAKLENELDRWRRQKRPGVGQPSLRC